MEAASGDLGNLPSFVPGDGDSDLTSCGRPGGVVPPDPWGDEARLGRALADAVPVASDVLDRTPDPSRDGACGSSRATNHSHSVLCPILRPPRVRAVVAADWSSASLDQCLFYRTVPREIFFRNMEIVGVIPARFASTRLPGKALLSETGRPLIQHVVEAARRAQSLERIIVATDDPRIAEAVTDFGGEVMMTRADHPTGTDRVAEVAARLEGARIIVNLQGDEPEISGAGARPRGRAARKRPRGADGHARDPDPRRVDLSRPGLRQGRLQPARPGTLLLAQPDPHATATGFPTRPLRTPPVAYLHLGLYAYRREFLLELGSLPPSPLEAAEKLEQLRVLEAGYPIAVGIVDEPSVGIDTPEDYRRFVARWRALQVS